MPHLSLRAKVYLLIAVVFVGAGVFFGVSTKYEPEGIFSDDEQEEVEVGNDWVSYRNDKLGFELSHPADWEVAEFPDAQIAPMFNVFKTGQTFQFPLTHHSSAMHVSVYPEGIPTEGVFGEAKTSAVSFSVIPRQATDFILGDGTPWATFMAPIQNHSEWSPAGFVWGSVAVTGLEIICLQNGREVSENECDPFLGDQIVRRGSVSPADWNTVEKILQSFRFLDGKAAADVVVDTPQHNHVVQSPLLVQGVARGFWFFEASFPVRLLDANEKELVVTPATAESDWMTTEFVPFTAVFLFEQPATATGFLVLEKDNPLGLPEHDAEVRIPIRFR